MTENDKLLLLKKGDAKTLKKLYIENREAFIAFGRKYVNSEEDILDVYQDAIIALQEQIVSGKLNNLNCTIKTYLFGIGKYMLFEKNRKKQKTILGSYKTDEVEDYETIAEDYYNEIVTERQRKLQEVLSKMGKKCKEILTLFYYRGYTIEDIKEHLNYENKNVVKSQKSRCLKQLKSKINE